MNQYIVLVTLFKDAENIFCGCFPSFTSITETLDEIIDGYMKKHHPGSRVLIVNKNKFDENKVYYDKEFLNGLVFVKDKWEAVIWEKIYNPGWVKKGISVKQYARLSVTEIPGVKTTEVVSTIVNNKPVMKKPKLTKEEMEQQAQFMKDLQIALDTRRKKLETPPEELYDDAEQYLLEELEVQEVIGEEVKKPSLMTRLLSGRKTSK